MFVFAGMPNIPNYLVKTFGGINPKLNIWRLRNIAGYGVDLSGYRQDVAPTAEEVREHILTVYHLLNPNCKKKDFHKKKVELLHYREDENCWSCGSRYTSNLLRVEVPSYLHEGARVFLNTAKRCSASYGMTYEYYGKDLLKDEPNGDYAKLFALRPEAIYDWFYSKERSVEDVVAMFELIEHSYVARPYLYYCKGEYTKVRQIFLIEVIKFMNSRPDETVHLTRRMRVSIHALIEKRLVSLNDVRLHYFPF